jgi:alpha-mannosidase
MAYPHRIVDGTPGLPDANLVMNVPGALVSAMKPADDDSGDIIIRLWETRGARTSGTITITQTDDQLHMLRCDALENAESNSLPSTGNEFSITLRPFEITTLRVTQ